MKFIYGITLMMSILIGLPIMVICIPFVFIGAFFSVIMTSLSKWIDYLNNLLKEG